MTNLIKSTILLFTLTVIISGCKKEVVEPQVEPVVFDDATKVVQDQDVISQLFVVAGYAQAIGAAQAQNQNFRMNCGIASFPTNCPTGSTGCVEIDFADCILLPSGLKLNGTLRFETFGTADPSDNSPANTLLRFSTFTINDRVISLPPSTFIRFQDIADPAAGYDFFEVFSSADEITVDHLLDNNTTKYIPFKKATENSPEPTHIQLRIEPSLTVDYTTNTNPQDFLLDLLNKDFIMKLEKQPGSDGTAPTHLWQAITCNSMGESIQELHLITEGTNNSSAPFDIKGLKFNLNCQHFTNGKLFMRKRSSSGCYYNYRDYDFGYEKGASTVCADQTGEACDDFVLLTEYTGGNSCNLNDFIPTGQCSNIDNLCTPECRSVQCF
jgi:hypothetical protein